MLSTIGTLDSLAERLSVSGAEVRWIRVGRLIDGGGERPLRDAHLVYDQHRILHVGNSDQLPPSDILAPGQTEPNLTLTEFSVLPGLIEAHAHLFLEGSMLDSPSRREYLRLDAGTLLAKARERLGRLWDFGLAAVRDAGDNRGVGLALRGGSADQARVPHLESPGPAVHRRGRYGSFMAIPLEDFSGPEACVEALCRLGADRIKLIATGIINFEQGAVTAPPQMSTEELEAFVQAARRRGKLTFAHASGQAGIERVVKAGVGSVEHGYFVSPDQLARMRDRGIGWVPTLAPVQVQAELFRELGWSERVAQQLRRILEAHREAIRRAFEMGVAVIAGSDAGSCGVPHGSGLWREMELMEEAGMPALAVISAATGKSAQCLELSRPLGRLAAGCACRLVLTRHCPSVTVGNLRRPKVVLFDGLAAARSAPAREGGL